MPTFTVVAGPNGSGKSTLTRIARQVFQEEPILDPDAVARSRTVASSFGGSPIDAGREVLAFAEAFLQAKQSFLVETTLSGNTYLRMMRRAKELGYAVNLIFVGTTDVAINLRRVQQRVEDGGHDVSEEDQRRRYPRSMANLRKALDLADEAILFDNSGTSHRRLAVKDEQGIVICSSLPEWASFLRPN